MKTRFARTLLAASVSLALAAPAHAALERMGPINTSPTVGGFPAWFQDKTGVALEFCDLMTQAELDGGWCTILAPGPVYPESFPNNFFIEHFYSDAVSTIKDANLGVRAKLVVAVEASFANGTQVVPGQQMTFGRIRVFITNLPAAGTYTIYHPFGKWIFPNMAAGDRIFFTEDVGNACVGTFTCTLGTSIGPFLLPSPVAGGGEVPPIPDIVPGQDPYYDILVNTGVAKPYPGTGKKYLADPGRIGPVTGSPLPPFVGNDGVTYNHNIFRVEGPNGYTLSSDQFSTNGRVMTGAMPGQVNVDRASYAQAVASTTGKKLDVFATGLPTATGRVPGSAAPPGITPILTFFDAPCGGTIDPNTGATLPPFTAPVGATETQMIAADTKYWGQAHPAAIPTAVCVEDSTTRNAAGQVVPTYYMATVTDEVTQPGGSTAFFDPANGGTLTVKGQGSDTLLPPVLTLGGYAAALAGTPPTATITPLAAPPAKVTVLSSEGGSADMLVQTAVGVAGGGPIPLATNDSYTIFEDCSPLPATSCATPFTFTPLANDTLNGAPLPAGSIVTITGPARIGTLLVNADGSMTYTPNPNVTGMEGIAYTVTVNGVVSNTAYITITMTPVNDLPVAVNDVSDAVVAKLNKINVLANDTDPDGAADLANAQILTWPVQLGAQPVPAAGVVSFTPTSTGTFSFTYNAVDQAGAVSATPATVTVNVLGSEAITIAKSIYKVGNQGGGISSRWTVQGTDSVREGQTLTIAYQNGTFNAANGSGSCNGTAANPNCVIGTAVVDGLGNYLYDKVLPPGGPSDPTDATVWTSKPTVINVFSSNPVLGGSKTNGITLK